MIIVLLGLYIYVVIREVLIYFVHMMSWCLFEILFALSGCRFKNKLQTLVCRKGAVGKQDMSPSSYALLTNYSKMHVMYIFIYTYNHIHII